MPFPCVLPAIAAASVRPCLTAPRWRQTFFSVAARDYLWLDVFLAAMIRDEWQPFERRLLEGVACQADAREEQSWPDEGRIEEAAVAFRYDRDLIASDETLAWIDRAGLTLEDWTDFLVRGLLRDQRRGELAGLVSRHAAALSVTPDAFAAEGICSGDFDAMAVTLAGRAAIGATLPPAHLTAGSEIPHRVEMLRARHWAWLGALDSDVVDERLTYLARLEASFLAHVRASTTADALVVQVKRNRLDWTRVDLERLSFDSEEAAREAVCCVREDGLSLTEVAIESGRTVRDFRGLLEGLEPELRDAVFSADVDQLVGPLAVGSACDVVWLVGKSLADLADPLVRARAEAAVVEQLVSRAVLSHVRWVERPRS